ncbi:secretin N-terminal domain-containing protein, partial [Roseateles sp. P5_E11]
PVPPDQQPSKFAQSRQASEANSVALQAANPGEVAAINLQQIPLATFVQVVYVDILKRNVSIDPAVLSRKDAVTFRTGTAQPAQKLEESLKLLLKTYGLAVIDAGGLLRVVPDNAQLGNLPEIRRDEVNPDTPLPLRPIYQFIEMKVVRQSEVANWLRTLFGDRIKLQEDITRNALVLNGTPDNVQAALEAIRVLDQPLMAGRKSVAITPAYWSADDLAKRLTEVLTVQGYAVAPLGQAAISGGARYPVVLLPVLGVNAVYVFANSDEVLNHVINWAKTLDKPNERGISRNFFTYQVKHKDAGDLAKTLDQLLSGRRNVSPATTPQGQPAASAAPAATSQRLTSVVVDQSSNTLIFQAEPDEYSQLTALLQMLDRPAKSALIEVTVAELALNDEKSSGVEWLYNRAIGGGDTASLGFKSLSADTSPLNLRILNGAGQLRIAISALAASDRASVLSSPRIHARNGEQAMIQVGSEVPIITSSVSSPLASGTANPTTTTLSTIQYRTAGVILKVKPVIHSGDQVDLEVEQEVSSADKTSTGVNNTPTFSTRKLQTKLTLRNGATVLMGGLITDNGSRGGGGIPWLKDVPVLGHLFGSQSATNNRREL